MSMIEELTILRENYKLKQAVFFEKEIAKNSKIKILVQNYCSKCIMCRIATSNLQYEIDMCNKYNEKCGDVVYICDKILLNEKLKKVKNVR